MVSFRECVADRHRYAEEWKARTGGKVLGYFDTYFPEELAYAAGVLPMRILAEHEPDILSDKWIYASCYPAKDMINQFLKGRYDYIDGLITSEGYCQWMFHAYEVITNNKPSLFCHYMFFPDYTEAFSAKIALRSELEVLKGRIEQWTGKVITEEALDNAIEVYNTNRRLLRKIYELRRADRPVILGAEAMQVMLASQVMDKAEMNPLLARYIEELEDRTPYEDRIRLMLVGSETHDTRLEELVESLGGNIVVDELDNGTSYCWNEVIPQKDRLLAIALRYLGRPHNPIKDCNWLRRPQHIFELFEDFGVDGVLVVKQIYCAPHGTDNYAVWKMLRERNVPFHFFERDGSIPVDETGLRLEAFMNMLRPGLTRLAGWHTPLSI